jgi:hypothetical protein
MFVLKPERHSNCHDHRGGDAVDACARILPSPDRRKGGSVEQRTRTYDLRILDRPIVGDHDLHRHVAFNARGFSNRRINRLHVE